MEKVKGFKGFNSDWTCLGFKYEMGKTFEMPDGDIDICKNGFHFCENGFDVLAYYPPTGKFAEVEGEGKIKKQGGTHLYERDYHPHSKPESLTLFRVDYEDDKKDEFVLNKLKNMFEQGRA